MLTGASSKLVVGLGNPGSRYKGTRHNVGFDVVDELARRSGADWAQAPRGIDALVARSSNVRLAKPLTFMNLSGHAVGDLLRFFKIELPDLLVVVDEVQLELGRLRIRSSGSAGGHNGLKSLIAQLGTTDFARLRIGVGRGDSRRDLADHVLATFDTDERATVADAIGRAADAAELFAAEGVGPVMNRFNRRDDPDEKEDDGKAPKREQQGKNETENGKKTAKEDRP
jgi:peptidyl-tRNA hydrolase, PTH1 family